jgi:hypothetical protein
MFFTQVSRHHNITLIPGPKQHNNKQKEKFHLFRTKLKKHCHNRQESFHFSCSNKFNKTKSIPLNFLTSLVSQSFHQKERRK